MRETGKATNFWQVFYGQFSAVAVLDHAGKITEFLPMPNNPHLRCYTAEMVGRVFPTPPMTPFYEQFEISVRERKAE